MAEAIVIGAGPAGLTAAYELAKLGMGSTILEADQQTGGISRTVNYKGYRFDIGGHRFFSKIAQINELWREILGDDLLLRPRLSRIFYNDCLFDYPLKPANALLGLGPIESLLVMLSYAKARLLPGKEAENFEQWVASRFGHRLYRIFFKTYTEKVWGIPCSEISADWAAQRIKNLSLSSAIRNALFGAAKSRDGQVLSTLIDEFHYPRLGPGMMWERCEQLLKDQGNETIHGVKVKRVRHRAGRVECVEARTDSGEMLEFGGDHFFSTMPLRSLVRSLDPAPPDEVLRAADLLRYRDYLTVVIIANKEDVFKDNWVYIHSPEVTMGRIQNYKNWSPEMVPDASRTSLGLEYFLWDKDDQWSWSDERLIELGIRECGQLGFVDPSEVEDGTVVRMKKAYPVYDQVYEQAVDTIRRYLATIENLQTIGRNGLHRYNNQDHSMLTGIYAARNAVGEKHDIWAVNAEQEYHEEGGEKVSERAVPRRLAAQDEAGATPQDEIMAAAFARLDPVAIGAALGLLAAVGLFLATAILLVKGGPRLGTNLSALGHYLIGYSVSWLGAPVGAIQAGLGGFCLGYLGAGLRNLGMNAYASLVVRVERRTDEVKILDRQHDAGEIDMESNELQEPQVNVTRAVARLKAGVLALVFGMIGGIGLFSMTVWLLVKGGPDVGAHLKLLQQYFVGYSVTWLGAFVGLIYGAMVGGAVGWAFGFIYNRIAGRSGGGADT